MTTTSRGVGSLGIVQPHDSFLLRRGIGREDHLEDFDALDLCVQRPPTVSQQVDEVDDLQGESVQCNLRGLKDLDLSPAAWPVEQLSPIAPQFYCFRDHREL